jgi:DNA polymerase-1
MKNLMDFYLKYWLPLGELLTEMEREGMLVDQDHMKNIELSANNDKFRLVNEFKSWVLSVDPSLSLFNPDSNAHMQQFLYAPFEKQLPGEDTSDEENVKKTANVSLKGQTFFPQERTFVVDGEICEGKKKKEYLTVKGLGLPTSGFTISGMPSVDAKALKVLSGEPGDGKYGKAFEFFRDKGNEELGKAACYAIDSLVKYKATETLIHSFIQPLIQLVDHNSRIHYSLNINTETGRLSAKKPNAQNQPALDKDKYKIRKAFRAKPGNKLIVADYGQLELRLLAHITNCKSMIDAFEAGGDFHSRTALSMYPKIKEAVEKKEVLLEWDSKDGVPPAPLLKNKFAAERKTAKTMNFSLAYGKTAHGFAKDWNCSIQEAIEALRLWYSERKEVEFWQDNVKKVAIQKGFTRTMMGRYRKLTDLVRNKIVSKRTHGLRAAINTPIQGSAADIVTAAMVRIFYCKRLKDLGWKMLLQIHDEIILEGPQDAADEALCIVKELMSHPVDEQLRIVLEVDAKIADNWYDAK